MKINQFKVSRDKVIREVGDKDRPRNDILIIADLNGETAKRFVIPVTSIAECLDAADVAYLRVMEYLQRRPDKTEPTEVIRSMVGTY